jgi:HSP20 family protein
MLTAWNAFPMLDRLFDDVMNDVTGKAFGMATQSTFNPAIDVRANDDQIVFVCDVPGLKREDLEITLENGVLSIRGQRSYQGAENDRVLLGRSYGAFANRFTLPDYVDAENMTADLADGVLTITVPKQPKAKPRRIEIGGKNGHKQLSQKSEKE